MRPLKLRNQTTVTVTTSDTQIASPQDRRWAIVIDSPVSPVSPQLNESVYAHGVDTSTTGVKLSYTVPAGVQAYLLSAFMSETTGTTVVAALEHKTGATVTQLLPITKQGTWSGELPLAAGDVIQWDVITAVAASVTDFALGILQDQPSGRVTISFIAPAVLDQGINLYPGDPPLVLLYDHVGQAVREDIHAIAASGSPAITVLDVFEEDCGCLTNDQAGWTMPATMKGG